MTVRWTTLSGSSIGSVHVRDQLPLQDAVLTWTDPNAGHAVVAVADGHGHKLHFRSDTGAALAVVSAVEELRRILPEVVAADDPSVAEELLRTAADGLVSTWGAKVRHHVEAHPYAEAELALGAGEDVLRAYGSTVLACAAVGDLVLFLQIGDGDSVLVSAHGEADRPLPEDPSLDGLHTSSLCQPRPLEALRTAVVDARVDDVALVFLCTDGFGRPRVDSAGWWRETGQQLLEFSRSRGLHWLAEPAQVGGDDTTMALLVRSDVAGIDRPDLADTVPVPETAGD
ncbi:protein phosphatase 2C-like protein [Nocardioides sp. J9]|uniref:protein phosphatase 2C domain-containing protein n=1 Tax=Nocardioides sp. J9 TaxID=935844 RepID=UPI00119D9F37|nr:protein phosphatase 2C domain-containing protein [Nocardioides sp. J9]TWG92320.1 protein phosphatase 2C-like protein [Nocardioides sp. J9]